VDLFGRVSPEVLRPGLRLVNPLATSEREQVARVMTDELRARLAPRGIAVEGVPLRRLTLPPRLAAAIEEKLGAEQEAQRLVGGKDGLPLVLGPQ
jgi:regulator of protease activity HflC (stomatin/prohibitin superfamily)